MSIIVFVLTLDEIEGNEPARIGGERKMRPLITDAQLSYQILKEFVYWKF